jgi:hypothetical protein
MGFLVQQAYAEVKPEAHISIDAGKFVTSASAEVIESNKNWLYSRSLLFTGVPLLHTGLRINGALLGTIAAPELVVAPTRQWLEQRPGQQLGQDLWSQP